MVRFPSTDEPKKLCSFICLIILDIFFFLTIIFCFVGMATYTKIEKWEKGLCFYNQTRGDTLVIENVFGDFKYVRGIMLGRIAGQGTVPVKVIEPPGFLSSIKSQEANTWRNSFISQETRDCIISSSKEGDYHDAATRNMPSMGAWVIILIINLIGFGVVGLGLVAYLDILR